MEEMEDKGMWTVSPIDSQQHSLHSLINGELEYHWSPWSPNNTHNSGSSSVHPTESLSHSSPDTGNIGHRFLGINYFHHLINQSEAAGLLETKISLADCCLHLAKHLGKAAGVPD